MADRKSEFNFRDNYFQGPAKLAQGIRGDVFEWSWIDDPENNAYALRTTEIITDVHKQVREIEENVLRGAVVDYLRELGYKVEEPTE